MLCDNAVAKGKNLYSLTAPTPLLTRAHEEHTLIRQPSTAGPQCR